MSDDRFEADWLALREPADHAARSAPRSAALVDRLRKALTDRPAPLEIVDLGAGTGSNARHLAPRLPGAQRWRLVDHDAALLERARGSLAELAPATDAPLTVVPDRCSLADPARVLDRPCDLVTASALLDLVSREWIEALAEAVAERRATVLVVLSVDGRWRFLAPDGAAADDEDAWMLDRYRAHQARDKGLGRALGGVAPGVLADALGRRGFDVELAPSPWRLAAGRHLPLSRALLAGWAAAIADQAHDARAKIERWAERRDRDLARGRIGVEVGHVDLLALPPDEAPT